MFLRLGLSRCKRMAKYCIIRTKTNIKLERMVLIRIVISFWWRIRMTTIIWNLKAKPKMDRNSWIVEISWNRTISIKKVLWNRITSIRMKLKGWSIIINIIEMELKIKRRSLKIVILKKVWIICLYSLSINRRNWF